MGLSSPSDKKKTKPEKRAKLKRSIDDSVSGDERLITIEQWSKSKKKRMRLRQSKEGKRPVQGSNIQNNHREGRNTTFIKSEKEIISHKERKMLGQDVSTGVALVSSSALQKSFQERLLGSRFRILNEELYTSTSSAAFKRFQENPSLFDEYHEGFRHQVNQWPVNPVTTVVERIKMFWETKSSNSNSKKKKKMVVADFGCGDAELAKQLLQIRGKNGGCPFLVHSFDLVAKGPNAELITACDSASTPLAAGCVDIGIYCLSLMGTNLSDFIREGHRVLKPDGKLLIAEVRSRFESSISKADIEGNIKGDNTGESDVKNFIQALDQLGFEVAHLDRSNKMFLLLDLTKNGKKPRKDFKFTAKPCIYKRR